MFDIKKYIAQKKADKQKWEDIKEHNRLILDNYNSSCRYYAECMKKTDYQMQIMYESCQKHWNDKNQVANLFRAFLMRPDFKEYQHILVFHTKKEYKTWKALYKNLENIIYIFTEGELPFHYYEYLAAAMYIVTDSVLPSCFVKQQHQTYVILKNVSLEKLEKINIDDKNIKLANQMHNIMLSDWIICPDEKILEKMIEVYRLDGVYPGKLAVLNSENSGELIWQTLIDERSSLFSYREISSTKKIKLLIYGGGMGMNGVTESFLALLRNINYQRFDVSVMCWQQDDIYSRDNINRIDQRARVFLTKGSDPLTVEEHLNILFLKNFALSGQQEQKIYEKSRYLLKRCIRRRIGDSSFDYIIDFSGYAPWVPLMFLEVPAKKRFIWEHSDLKLDFEIKNNRTIGKKTIQLSALLSIYEKFDFIVSVNEELKQINQEKLGTETTKTKFYTVTNLLDDVQLTEKIKQAQMEPVITDRNGYEYYVYDNVDTSINGTMHMIPAKKTEVDYRFVTMGRLSQEKNHENLIMAFKNFLHFYPKSQLFIIGKGILMEELQDFINKNKLSKQVILTGNLKNPYLLMSKCNCFVLPSLYEGQGLAVLEARMMHMPIVMTNYDTVASVSVENGQYIVGMDVESILDGLLAFTKGNVPLEYTFDVNKYNHKSLQEFEALFEES